MTMTQSEYPSLLRSEQMSLVQVTTYILVSYLS